MRLSELRARIDELFEQLAAEGYVGHQERVSNLITHCRAMLSHGTGSVGPWEAWQLGVAERAVGVNFLRLGLIAAQNALAVSQLGAEEYDYGRQQISAADATAAAKLA